MNNKMFKFKNILIPISFIFFLISCQKEFLSVPDSNRINFFVRNSPIQIVETRSTLIDNSEQFAAKSFGVFGYCVPYAQKTDPNANYAEDFSGAKSVWEAKKGLSIPDIFNNQEISYTNDTKSWEYSNARPWESRNGNVSTTIINPADYKYTFIAYYPYQSTVSSSSPWTITTNIGAPTLTYTIPIETINIGSKTYLDDSEIQDVMYAYTFDHLRSWGSVPLTFKHIMTGVNVKLVSYEDNSTIHINSIELNGTFRKVYKHNFSNNEITYDGSHSYPYYLGSTTLVKTSSIYESDTVLLLCEDKLGENVEFVIDYDVDNQDRSPAHLPIPDNLTIVPGTVYTFTVSFINNTVYLQLQTDRWDHGGDSVSTIK